MGGSDDDNKFDEVNDQSVAKCTSPLRWIILVLACVMLIGSYYCYDIPAAIKTQLDDYMGNPSDYELKFGLLYTLYAAPNTILPFFGGYLVDRFGVRVCMLLFASTITVGQVIVSVGVSSKSWPVIFLGRFVFGLGGECFSVANSAFLADWFKGSELAFAFGVNLAVAKLGSVINNVVSPALVEDTGIIFAFWFGAILCGASVLCVLLAIPMDRNMEAKMAKGKYISVSVTEDEHGNKSTLKIPRDDEEEQAPVVVAGNSATSFKDVFTLSHIFWVLVVSCMVVYGCVLPFNNISSSLLLERDYFIEPPSGCHLPQAGCQSSTNEPVGCPSSKWYQPPLPYDVTVAGKPYTQVTATDVDCTSDDWANGGCTSEYCSRLTDAESEASVIMSIPYIISACLSPPVGFLVDRYGMRAVIATLAPLMLVIVHLLLAITSVNAIGPLVGQGLAYTGFVSVLWPSVPLVVEDRLTGLGFGIVTSVQNLGVAVLPLVAASIYTDSGDKYIPNVEFMFVGLGAAGTLVGLYMNYYDYKNNSVLNRGYAAAEAARRDEEGLLSYKNNEPLLNPVNSNFNQRGSNDLSFDGAEDKFVESDLRNRSVSRDGRTYSREARGPRGSSFTIYEEINKAGVYHH